MVETQRHSRRVFLAIGFCAAISTSVLPVPAFANVADPQSLIATFHEQLLPILAVERDSTTVRSLSTTVADFFHMRLITRIVVGDHWKAMDSASRQRLAAAILDMNVAIYMNQLGDARLAGHTIDGVRDGQQGTSLVDASLSTANGELPLTYVTREIKGRWWIIDVLIERKFSELSLRQAEYQGVIRQSGVDGLISTLETKAAQLASN